jgi:hypothetical protein
MDTTRLQRPARVRIESATTTPGTRVYINDEDVTNDVVAVTWAVNANDRRPPTATVTFIQADINGEAELADETPAPEAGLELRAVDLAVLDVRPGDTIVFRTAGNLDDAERDSLMTSAKTKFPDHKVMVLEGGLELALLRQESEDATASHRFATDGDHESFLATFGSRLDDWFTPEFAAYVRRGPQPVVPRKHVIPVGEPFRGFKSVEDGSQ